MQDADVLTRRICKQCLDLRPVFGIKGADIFDKFGILLRLLPGHIGAGLTDACAHARKAFLQGQIQPEEGIAGGKTRGKGAAVVPVDDPALAGENFRKAAVEFLP